MATVEMPQTKPCQFGLPWRGACGKPTDNGWCTEHEHLECVSCGRRAVRQCEDAISLVCGANLCNDCVHNPDGPGHVTRRVAKATVQHTLADERAKVASRTSSVQRVDDSGLPLNLFEFRKNPPEGFEIKDIYYLELEHGLMGFFPAIIRKTKQMILTADCDLLIRLWSMLSVRKSKVGQVQGYVNLRLDLVYLIPNEGQVNQEESRPHPHLSVQKFDAIIAQDPNPFTWAPGLVGNDMSPADFHETIEEVARQHSIILPRRISTKRS